MSAAPKIEQKTLDFILDTVEEIYNACPSRQGGTSGEKKAQEILKSKLERYSDEIKCEPVKTHLGALVAVDKFICILLIISVILFFFSVGGGNVLTAGISLFLSLLVFCIFTYKYIFDGKLLDKFSKPAESQNIYAVRYGKNKTENRVVLVSGVDSPLHLRTFGLKSKSPFILSACSLLGNTLLFISSMFFLLFSAPQNSTVFSVLSFLCLIFLPFYVMSFFLVKQRGETTGISSSLVPSALTVGLLKQFHDNSFRFENTEVCVLLAGCQYSGKDGAYIFCARHYRLFRDVPTVFIPIEEITTSKKLSVFYKDASGEKGSPNVASVIGDAADNLNLTLINGRKLFGTGAFKPFTKYGLSACSLGSSKEYISKTVTNADKLSQINDKAVTDVGALLIETINYYDC
ncbi:MAG: hypothetical protein ACI4IF_04795 [Acutalibacteraceae bacterium]